MPASKPARLSPSVAGQAGQASGRRPQRLLTHFIFSSSSVRRLGIGKLPRVQPLFQLAAAIVAGWEPLIGQAGVAQEFQI